LGIKPRISIIVATFNSGKNLQTCLDSASEQKYPNKEIIVIDGASVDGTVDVIRANEHRLSYWESAPDRGVYHAWNKALTHASGDWIQFLGSDDWYTAPDVLERLAPTLKGVHSNIGLVYGKLARVTPTGEVLEIWGENWERTKPRLKGQMSIPHGAAFHHKSLFGNAGGFDDNFKIAGDYEFMLRVMKGRDSYFVDDLVVIAQGCHGTSSVPETAFRRNAEMVRARKLNGLWPYPFCGLPLFAQNCMYGAAYYLFGKRGATLIQNAYRRMTGRRVIPPE